MTDRIIIYAGTGVVFIALAAYFGWKFVARGAYETAGYTVVQADGQFEIRKYEDLTMATTDMQFQSQGDDGSFMRLFQYISGANDQQQKVAMTTPVFMQPETQATPGEMGFVIPKNVAQRRVPAPSNRDVQLRERPGGKYAVIRFAGRLNRDVIADAEAQLVKWMDEQSLTRDGAAEVAGYDPPWTPGPLRRNEVLIRLK